MVSTTLLRAAAAAAAAAEESLLKPAEDALLEVRWDSSSC
jgi:hypothetical protein